MNILYIFGVGFAGAFVFTRLHLPGGAMTGAMLAVVIFKTLAALPVPAAPSWLSFCVYASVGVLVGNMYKPEMLYILRDTWPALLSSTVIILLAGCLCTYVVARSGALSVSGAYLATSPGGFNAIVGLAGNNTGEETPIIMVYHLVRIYAIVLLAPYIARFLGAFIK